MRAAALALALSAATPGCHKAEPAKPAPAPRPPVAAPAGTTPPLGGGLVMSSGAALARGDVEAALGKQRPHLRACSLRYRVRGVGAIAFHIAPSGQVLDAAPEGAFDGTPTGACLADAVRAIHFPSFAATAPIEVHYPLMLP